MASFISKTILVSLAVSLSANALPTTLKRDFTTDSTQPWLKACQNAGGGDKCSTIRDTATQSLLSTSGICAQQNAADQMINLAKTLDNNAEMITLAQIFVQQPREPDNSEATPYCQQPPANTELDGLYPCQFEGVNQDTFAGGVAVGGTDTIPYDLSAAVNPAGSCPAHPSGPITDNIPLGDITSSPGSVTNGSGEVAASPGANPSKGVSVVRDDPITASSPCTDGQNACFGTSTGLCINGQWSLTQCPGNEVCGLTPAPGSQATCTTSA